MKLPLILAAALLASPAFATNPGKPSGFTDQEIEIVNRLYARQRAEAQAKARSSATARSDATAAGVGLGVASGGDSVATGGGATATGDQRARTGDVSVTYSEENPTNAAYAPSIGAGSNYHCDRFFGVSFGGNGDTRSISGGFGIPYEAETCAIAYAAETVAALTNNEAAVNAILATMDRVRDAGVTYDPATGRLVVGAE